MSSCVSKYDNNFEQEYELDYTFLKDIFLNNPQVEVMDSFLILLSHTENEKVCNFFSIEDNYKEIGNYGKIGNGPYEFKQPILTYANGSTFGINDINDMTLSIMKIMNRDTFMIREQVRLKAPYLIKKNEYVPKCTHFRLIGKRNYVSTSYVEDGKMFMLSDSLLQPISFFGDSPIVDELSMMMMRNRLQGHITTFQNCFVYGCTDLPYLAFYQLNNDKMEKKWDMFYKKEFYEVSNKDLKFYKDKSTGPLLDLRMDSKYIYALYMDQLLSEYDYYRTDKSCSNKIYVFDYNGEKVACLNLNCRLSKIAVDNKKHKIYGISHLPDYSLVVFNIPNELLSPNTHSIERNQFGK